MLISIVIPALNEENYIERTLKSARAQRTSHEIELIVGDGFSTDRTVEIAKKYADMIVLEKNRSAAWQRQAGARVANGEIIAFTDADAELPPDWVEKIVAEFSRDESLAMVYSPVGFFDMSGFEDSVSRFSFEFYASAFAFAGLHSPSGANMAVRKGLFEIAGGFDTSLSTCEDIDLARRLGSFGSLKFFRRNIVRVSPRRVKAVGYLNYAIYHIDNLIRFSLTGKSTNVYVPVR